MTKLTYSQLLEKIHEHNDKNQVKTQFSDKHPLNCVIVFKEETWPGTNFSLEARSYRFRSDNKRFLPDMIGNSIFADALDGSDDGVRLDWYIPDWIIDYCYIKE